MNIVFEELNEAHSVGVMRIYNYYVASGTAAFFEKELPESFYSIFLSKASGYPAYAVIDSDINSVVGFCMLSAFMPHDAFLKTACVTYFIADEYTGKGIGEMCLNALVKQAAALGIRTLIADISTENIRSIAFHEKNGFHVVGRLDNIGEKHGRSFGIVYMQLTIE